MGQKIDSSSSGASSATLHTNSPTDSKTAEQADVADDSQVANIHDEDSWNVGDAVEDFWGDVKGTAADAEKKLRQSAADAEKTVRDAVDGAEDLAENTVDEMLEDFERKQNTIEAVGDNIVEGGEELFGQLQEQGAEFSRQLGETIEEHQDQVEQVTGELLDGAWNVGRDIAEVASLAGAEVAADAAEVAEVAAEVADVAVEVAADARDYSSELKADLVQLGARQVVEHQDVIVGAGELAEQVFGEQAPAAMDLLELTTPGFAASRTAILSLANAAKASPEVAEQLANNRELVRGLVGANDAEAYQLGVEELEIGGDAYVAKSGLSAEIYSGVGGEIGHSVEHRVERTGPNSYRLEIERSVAAGLGGGAKVQDAGSAAKVEAEASGRIVVEVSGEHAAEDVARMMSAAGGNTLDLLRLSGESDVEFHEAFGSLAPGASVEASGVDVAAGKAFSPGFKTIDGQKFVGGRASVSMSFDVDESAQIPDNAAELLQNDSKLDHPVAEQLFGGLPDDLVQGLANAYGPTAGVKVGAEPSVSVGVFTPAGQTEPIRLEFEAAGTMTFGRTDLEVKTQATITDVGGLSERLDLSTQEVIEGLRSGELTPEGLDSIAADLGKSIDDFVEYPSVEVTATSFDGLDLGAVGSKLGLTHARGSESSVEVYPPPQGNSVVDQLRVAAQLEEQAVGVAHDVEDPNLRKLGAHIQSTPN